MCDIPGCTKNPNKRLCAMHEARKRRHGDPNAIVRSKVNGSYADQLREKCRVESSGCWVWTGSVNASGYGTIVQDTVRDYAHRAAYVEAHGVIPVGLHVLHSCDNPPCINPDHLRVGTNYENIVDRIARGRSYQRSPEWHPPTTKLSKSNVVEIRRRRLAGETAVALGREFGVHARTITEATKRDLRWFD